MPHLIAVVKVMNKYSKIILHSALFFLLSFSPLFCQEISNVQSLLSDEGRILFGNEPNSVMVIDYPENIKLVEQYLSMVDVAPSQVLIEARIVEVKLQGEHALGVNWSAFMNEGALSLGQFNLASTAASTLMQQIPYKNTYYPPGTTTAGNIEQPFSITIFDENISIVLQTLANNLDTDVLSAPSITVVNNHSAEIRVVRSLPWAEPEVETLEGGGISVTWSVNFEEVGIVLEVTPTITEDGQIILEIAPEVSEKYGDYPLTVTQGTTTIPYTVPIIDRRTADTKVVIGNRQTLIIGGLIKDTVTKGVTKVPLLGDIPILGWLFKSTKDTRDKSELLIFVSPTIITPTVMTKMETLERHGMGEWYMDERRDQFEEATKKKQKHRKDVSERMDGLEIKIRALQKSREDLEDIVDEE